MKSLFYSLSMFILLLFSACHNPRIENNNDPAKVKINVPAFLDTAIQGGLVEIKASGLAITNSNNQRVINLAKMMLDDHTQTDSALMHIQVDKKLVARDTIDLSYQQVINDLAKQQGAAFDKSYLTMMVASHQAAVQSFSRAANCTDNVISKLAAATVPEIQMHLDSARAVLTSLK
jgi:putative membrane protein